MENIHSACKLPFLNPKDSTSSEGVSDPNEVAQSINLSFGFMSLDVNEITKKSVLKMTEIMQLSDLGLKYATQTTYRYLFERYK